MIVLRDAVAPVGPPELPRSRQRSQPEIQIKSKGLGVEPPNIQSLHRQPRDTPGLPQAPIWQCWKTPPNVHHMFLDNAKEFSYLTRTTIRFQLVWGSLDPKNNAFRLPVNPWEILGSHSDAFGVPLGSLGASLHSLGRLEDTSGSLLVVISHPCGDPWEVQEVFLGGHSGPSGHFGRAWKMSWRMFGGSSGLS